MRRIISNRKLNSWKFKNEKNKQMSISSKKGICQNKYFDNTRITFTSEVKQNITEFLQKTLDLIISHKWNNKESNTEQLEIVNIFIEYFAAFKI